MEHVNIYGFRSRRREMWIPSLAAAAASLAFRHFHGFFLDDHSQGFQALFSLRRHYMMNFAPTCPFSDDEVR